MEHMTPAELKTPEIIDTFHSLPEGWAFKAAIVAEICHHGQFRRDGVTPYIVHPRDVASRFGKDDVDAIVVSLLHDVLEDCTEISPLDLLNLGFKQGWIDAIVLLTKDPNLSYEENIERVATNPLSLRVKIADNTCNLADDPTPKQIKKYTNSLAFLMKARHEMHGY